VRVHPETNERSLALGGFARTVLGFTPQASRDLIRLLQEYITRPEQTVRWHWRVQIRAALPGIVTGMRISMAGAWTSIVAAELIAATTGLGYLIMQAGDYLNTALVFSGIIAIAILGLALDAGLRGLLLLVDPSRRR
jgi:ABC-type nitrate/sulfonate/bicarbonate transport system permease component